MSIEKVQSDYRRAQTALQSVGDTALGVDARGLFVEIDDEEFQRRFQRESVLSRARARVASVRVTGVRVKNTIQVGAPDFISALQVVV